MKVVNLSGHPITDASVEVIEGPVVGNVKMDDPSSVEDAANKLAQVAAQHEGVPVVLPGMAPLAAAVLAKIHGRTGSFPTIRWAVRVDGAFVFTEAAVLDLHTVRTEARLTRFHG
jgi:hypothetical protein